MNPALATNGLAGLLATIHGLYPQARVTSGYRGPNNPLTQRNPASMHAMGSPDDPRAVDVAPIPGVSFDQYVSSVRNAGVPVSQAFDEQKHPFPWTTGPNWHLGQGQAPVTPVRKPKSLAEIAAPNLDAQAPVDMTAQPQVPQSLADLASGLPTMQGKKPSPFTASNILGVLGDALMAYGGLQPQFGPGLAKQHQLDQEHGFDREKWAQQLELQRQKSAEPPQFVQNLQAWLALPEQAKQQYIQYQDITNPIAISTPQGTKRIPREMGGNTKTINGTTYYNINGEWYDNPEGR